MSVSTELFLEYKKRPGRAGLARLLERHQDAVYSLCYRVLRHPQDAEDACQEVLLEVARQVDAIEQPGGFAGWLYRTALHTSLDVKRRRGRRKVREAAARRATPPETDEAHDALHEGLAGLDETSRMLVVEHYLAQRPLRELAEERGCSEVAIWKRIRDARERLRRALGSAAMAALEGVVNVHAPAKMLKTVAAKGGLLMAAKGGIKMAIAVPLLLLAGAGTVAFVRQPDPPAPTKVSRKTVTTGAPEGVPVLATTSPSPRVGVEAPLKSERSGARRPYPLRLPAPGYSAEALNTWMILCSKRITANYANEPLPMILQDFARLIGISMAAAPGREQEFISMQLQDMAVEGCLRLMLQPREMDYEIRPDGSVLVGPKDTLQGGYEREARQRAARCAELDKVRQELNSGWDGISGMSGARAEAEAVLRTRRITVPQGETTIQRELIRILEEFRLEVYVDDPVDGPGYVRQQAELNRPFLQSIAEQTVGLHVEGLAQHLGLTAVVMDHGAVFLSNGSRTAAYRAEQEQKLQACTRMIGSLDRPVADLGTVGVQDFLDSIPRSHGLQVVPTAAVWEGGESLSLPLGTTLRQALDQLRTQGCRWALRDGKLYVLK